MAAEGYGPDVRIELCRQCGATYGSSNDAGQHTCAACGEVSELATRELKRVRLARPAVDPGLEGTANTAARQEALAEQALHYNPRNPYSTVEAPPGLEYLDEAEELSPGLALQAQQSFTSALQRLQKGGGPQLEHTVYWLARMLGIVWFERDEPERARAVLMAAEQSLMDPGYKHLLRCTLSVLAYHQEDLRGAADWLALCDDAPWLLEPDSALRIAQAALAAGRLSWDMVLELVGQRTGDIPCDPSAAARIRSVRNTALEQLGRELEPATDDEDGETDDDALTEHPRRASEEAEAAAEAAYRESVAEEAESEPFLASQSGTKATPPEPNIMTLFGALMIFLIAAILGFIYLPDVLKAGKTPSWKPTTGRVTKTSTETDVTTSGCSQKTVFVPVAEYHYTVAGRRYTSRRITWFREDVAFESPTDAHKVLAKYPRGPVTVYYNPDNPGEAVLQRGRGGGSLEWVLITGGMLTLALIFASVYLFSLFRRRRWAARQKR